MKNYTGLLFQINKADNSTRLGIEYIKSEDDPETQTSSQ
jgi:hypothetical protein